MGIFASQNTKSDAVSRNQLRAYVRRASKGDILAFQPIVDQYLDLVSEYIRISGYHVESEISALSSRVFENLWLRIGFSRRVSDMERKLFLFLKQIPVKVGPFQDILTQRLLQLSAQQRFILVARDMENWNFKQLSLATRTSKADLHQQLFRIWSVITEFTDRNWSPGTLECLQQVVANMEGNLDPRKQQSLCRRITADPEASQFKTACLLQRVELVEMRQNARWDAPKKASYIRGLIDFLQAIKPLRPQLTDRILNGLSFKHFPLQISTQIRM